MPRLTTTTQKQQARAAFRRAHTLLTHTYNAFLDLADDAGEDYYRVASEAIGRLTEASEAIAPLSLRGAPIIQKSIVAALGEATRLGSVAADEVTICRDDILEYLDEAFPLLERLAK